MDGLHGCKKIRERRIFQLKKPSRKWCMENLDPRPENTHTHTDNLATLTHCHPFLSFPASHEPSATFNCKAPWNRCGLRGVRMSLLANQTPDLINIAGKQSYRRTCCEGVVLLTSGDTNDVITPTLMMYTFVYLYILSLANILASPLILNIS